MKIYVAHSTAFDYQNELYSVIKNHKANLNYKFILPHENSDSQYNSKELFINHACDYILAECSYPSIGLGIELGFANCYKIPILAICKHDIKISSALEVVTKDIYYYSDLKNYLDILLARFN